MTIDPTLQPMNTEPRQRSTIVDLLGDIFGG
jgi:hypothetical protein